MSVTRGNDDMQDYSSYEYQQIHCGFNFVQDTTANPSASNLLEFDVLQGQGGLANNEVAELVYMDVEYYIEFEDESGDQDVASQVEMRGVIGANLPTSEDIFMAGGDVDVTGDVFGIDNGSESEFQPLGRSQVEDRVFQHYAHTAGHPADDETNGPGSNGITGSQHKEKHFREISHRGPVMDSSDDFGVGCAINAGNTVINFSAQVRINLVWDVAETDDAGRAFSVPN